MSDVKDNKLVTNRHQGPHSEPIEGHGGTSFEGVDATPGLIIYSLSIIAGTLVAVFLLTIFMQRFLAERNPAGELPSPLAPARVVPPAPQIQVHPWEELPEMRAHENAVLNESGRDAQGHLHIPIDQAMGAVVSRLNVAPGAPQGITTPGGEGRAFAGSVTAMPAPYQRPQIQGEIRKNAQ